MKWKFVKYDGTLNNCQHFAYSFGQWLAGKRETSLDMELVEFDEEIGSLIA